MTKNKVNLAVLIFVALCIGSILFSLQKIALDQSPTLEQMLTSEHLTRINQHRELFAIESEPVIVALRAPEGLSTERVSTFENALVKVPGVTSSLSSVSLDSYGSMVKESFSPRENTQLILLMISSEAQQLKFANSLAIQLQETVNAQLRPSETAIVVGIPQIRAASWRISREDTHHILPLLVASTLAVTLLMFGSSVALALSLLLTSLTTCICLALQLVISAQLSSLTFLVIPVIWSIATLDAFHLYSRAASKAQQNHPTPAKAASRELFLPCLLTTLTTAGCFLTLVFLDTSALIVNFGLWCAAGTILAFALTFTVGEKLLSWYDIRRMPPRWPRVFCLTLVRTAQRQRSMTIGIWAVLVVAAVFFAPNLGVATSFPQVFTQETEIATQIDEMKSLTDSDLNAFDLILKASDAHGQERQSLASAGLLLTNYLKTIEESRLVLPIGVIDESYLNELFEKWQRGENIFANPDKSALHAWLNEQKHALRLQVYLAQTSHSRKAEIISWLEHFDETMLSHHKIELSGSGYFHHATEKKGLKSLVLSSVLSFFLVSGVMYWITRGKSQAWVAVCGCVVPALIVVGGMAAFSVPWSIAMLPMPVLLLGLMNDDTIHITWNARNSHLPYNTYVTRNAIAAGPALFATTLVLSSAIGMLAISSIQTNRLLGVLIPLGLLLAFLCNLTLLPALNSWLHKSSQLQH